MSDPFNTIDIYVGWFDDEIEHVERTTIDGVVVHRLGMTPHKAFTLSYQLLDTFKQWQKRQETNSE